MNMAKPKKSSAPITIEAVKGFDEDWTCRGFKYEIGQTYIHTGPVVRCGAGGFHACENPMDVWNYYSFTTSKFALVDMGGEIARDDNSDSKITAAQITIKEEMALQDFIRRAVDWVLARAKDNTATGHSGHAAATGNRGHAAATGDSGHAAATGEGGHAAATGKQAIAASLGINATAMAGCNGWIVLAAWRQTKGAWEIATIRTAQVDGPEGIKAGVTYRLSASGSFEEVI
jgi:hypothetical protein